MTITSAITCGWIGFGGVVLLCGAVLWFAGRFAGRRGATPHCRRCGYALTGIDSRRCPECGRELTPRNVVHGERPRRPRLTWAGRLLAAVGLLVVGGVGYERLRLVDWYRYRPAGWVVDDAVSADGRTANKAWAELGRRRDEGGLSAAAEQNLIAVALDEHSKPEGLTRRQTWQRLVDHLGARYDAGGLSAEQSARFLSQLYKFDLTVRPIVGRDERVRYRVRTTADRPSSQPNWYQWTEVVEGLLDDRRSIIPAGEDSSGMLNSGASNRSFDSTSIGPHTLTLRYRITLRRKTDGEHGGYPQGPPTHVYNVTLRQPFEVVDRPAEELVQLIDRPDLEPGVRAAIRLEQFGGRNPNSLSVRLKIADPPENVAFDASIWVGGRRLRLGTLAVGRGERMSFYLPAISLALAKAGKADFILESSPLAARHTVDLDRIWMGEIRFEGVPIQRGDEDEIRSPLSPTTPVPPTTTTTTTRPATSPNESGIGSGEPER